MCWAGSELAAAHFLIDCIYGRYRITDEGLHYWSVFSGKRLFKWSELTSVRYASMMKWFVLRNTSGEQAHLSVMVTGLQEFAAALIYHAPAVIVSSSETVVRETANGKLPSLWG